MRKTTIKTNADQHEYGNYSLIDRLWRPIPGEGHYTIKLVGKDCKEVRLISWQINSPHVDIMGEGDDSMTIRTGDYVIYTGKTKRFSLPTKDYLLRRNLWPDDKVPKKSDLQKTPDYFLLYGPGNFTFAILAESVILTAKGLVKLDKNEQEEQQTQTNPSLESFRSRSIVSLC